MTGNSGSCKMGMDGGCKKSGSCGLAKGPVESKSGLVLDDTIETFRERFRKRNRRLNLKGIGLEAFLLWSACRIGTASGFLVWSAGRIGTASEAESDKNPTRGVPFVISPDVSVTGTLALRRHPRRTS